MKALRVGNAGKSYQAEKARQAGRGATARKAPQAEQTRQACQSANPSTGVRTGTAGQAAHAGRVIRGRILGSAIGVVLLGVAACTEPPTTPPVTLGELALTRCELIPERYTLEVPVFNTGAAQLERYRISAYARAGAHTAAAAADAASATLRAPVTAAEESPPTYPVELTVAEPVGARARTVQTVTFDCPLAVIPLQGLTLMEITFFDFHFSSGPAEGVIEYGYPVEETQ